jgi:hypothetical protein
LQGNFQDSLANSLGRGSCQCRLVSTWFLAGIEASGGGFVERERFNNEWTASTTAAATAGLLLSHIFFPFSWKDIGRTHIVIFLVDDLYRRGKVLFVLIRRDITGVFQVVNIHSSTLSKKQEARW